VLYRYVDKEVIDGMVNGAGSSVRALGASIRYLQSGNIGLYIMGMVTAAALIILFTFIVN
jgi:NADH-quinone oxidoreductase subunit L